jgi:hypothetical protein
VDRLGLCAELAAGQLLGLAPDLSIYDGPDPGYDFQLAWGTLDVKATRHPHGMLLFNDVHAFRADAAMLVVVPDR